MGTENNLMQKPKNYKSTQLKITNLCRSVTLLWKRYWFSPFSETDSIWETDDDLHHHIHVRSDGLYQLFPLLIRNHTLSSFWIPNYTGQLYLAWLTLFFLIENFYEPIPHRKKLIFDCFFRGTLPQNKEEEASIFKSSHTVVINACLILSTFCHIPKE